MSDRMESMMKRVVNTLGTAVLAAVLVSVVSWAATVSRPTKTCGTTTYVDETGAGCTFIKNTEVDADLAALIAGINTVESAQIANGTIVNADIANNAINDLKIQDGSVIASDLAANSITSAKIVDGAIIPSDIALNGTTNAFGSGNVDTSESFDTTETTVLTLSSVTTRGGRVIILGAWSVAASFAADLPINTITIRVKRDGSTISTLTWTPLTQNISESVVLPFPTTIDTAATAAAHVYTVTVQTNNVNVDIVTPASNAGAGYALELT